MADRSNRDFAENAQFSFDFDDRARVSDPCSDRAPDAEPMPSSSEHDASIAPHEEAAPARPALDNGATMADLLPLVAADPELSASKKANLSSSIRVFVRTLGLDLQMPASFHHYREHLKRFSLANARFSERRWANIRSDVAFALDRYGARRDSGRPSDLSPAWQALRDGIEKKTLKLGLSRLMHWASRQEIEPAEVDDKTMTAFHRHLIEETFEQKPDKNYRRTCRLWNDAAASVPDWPQKEVSVPSFRKLVSMPRQAFPASLWNDFERYRSIRLGHDLSSEHGYETRADESTLEGQAYKLVKFATAMVRAGRSADEITELKSLFDVPWFERAMQAEFERMGGPRPGLQELAATLLAIGRHYVVLPEERIEALRRIKQRIKCRPRGFTPGNREKLRQFADERNRYAFLHFAQTMLKDADKAPSEKKRALRIQTALLHAILLAAPIRLQNLTSLHVRRHFRFSRPGRKGHAFLVIPGDEVKNEQELEFALPLPVTQLLCRYLNEARPVLLSGEDAGWLFPGAAPGNHKNHTTLAGQLCRAVKKHIGLTINPHLYRHIAALLYLQRYPGDLETVRRLLGHTSQETTTMFYADIDKLMASRLYNEAILEECLAPNPSASKTRGRHRKNV